MISALAGALVPMTPAAQVLCLLHMLVCAGGATPAVVFADTGPVTAVYQPLRSIRLVPPADLPPDPATLRPGLAVRTADVWVERQGSARDAGVAGNDWRRQLYLPTGYALSRLSGFIRFERPGAYRLRLAAEAPVRLSIAALEIYDSGEAPAGGLSPPLPFDVSAAGWYPLTIGISSGESVRLDWQVPGDPQTWVRVPAAMLAH